MGQYFIVIGQQRISRGECWKVLFASFFTFIPRYRYINSATVTLMYTFIHIILLIYTKCLINTKIVNENLQCLNTSKIQWLTVLWRENENDIDEELNLYPLAY